MKGIDHHFSVELACKIGTDCAIIYKNLEFWCIKNKANKKHFYDGFYWTYNSAKAFKEIFPYMNERKILRDLAKLEELGYIKSGNYNGSAYDRTKWYCVANQSVSTVESKDINCRVDMSILSNGDVNNVEPIPYSKPFNKLSDNNTDKYNSDCQSENSDQHEVKNLFGLNAKTETQKEKKVAPKKEKGIFSKFMDIWREVESEKGTHVYNFTATPGKDAANGTKIYKLLQKEIEGTDFVIDDTLKHFLILAYDYFKTWKTPDFKFTPSMCLSQYNQIKTTRKPEISEKELRMRQMFNY